MTTIDKLDIAVYTNYALRITLSEQINSQLRMTEASSIPPQLQMVDISPRLTELDLVLGVIPFATPWAYFYPPQRFRDLRRNPFSFFRAGPSFGSIADQEQDEATLENIPCPTTQDEAEKGLIRACLKQMGKINEMKAYIIGRIGQFLQG